MPIRSGAMQRPRGCRCGNTLRQRYDEVGLPCSSTMGSPCPTSTYAISLPRTRRRCLRYGNTAEIMFLLLLFLKLRNVNQWLTALYAKNLIEEPANSNRNFLTMSFQGEMASRIKVDLGPRIIPPERF